MELFYKKTPNIKIKKKNDTHVSRGLMAIHVFFILLQILYIVFLICTPHRKPHERTIESQTIKNSHSEHFDLDAILIG